MSSWSPNRAVAAGRQLRNQTQAGLAAKLTEETGELWTRNTVASLETGRKTFSVEALVAIAKIQDLPFEFYLGGSVIPGYLIDLDDAHGRVVRNTNGIGDGWDHRDTEIPDQLVHRLFDEPVRHERRAAAAR